MNLIRVCIIGFSYGYKVFYPIIKKNNNFKLVGICSKNIRSKKKLIDNKKIIISSSWKYVLLKAKPDLVLIATIPKVQEEILS